MEELDGSLTKELPTGSLPLLDVLTTPKICDPKAQVPLLRAEVRVRTGQGAAAWQG